MNKSRVKSRKYKEPFLLYLQKQRIVENKIEMKQIKNLLKKILPSISFEFFTNEYQTKIDLKDNDLKYCNNDVEMNLFYWCVLSNRIELSKLFWKMGKVNFSKNKILRKIFKCMCPVFSIKYLMR